MYFLVIFVFLFLLLFYKTTFLKSRYVILALYIFSLTILLTQELVTKILTDLYLRLVSLIRLSFLLKYAGYFQSVEPISWIKCIIYNMLSMLHILAIFRLKKVDIKETKYKNLIGLFVYGVIFINLFSFLSLLTRSVFYFQIFQLLTIPSIIKKIEPKNIVFLIMVCFYFLQFIYGLNHISPFGYKIFLPYRGYLGGNYELYSE